MHKDKREIAAISAVIALISSEQTEYNYHHPTPGNPSHSWSAYGRSSIMQYRDLCQRRIITRSR